MAGSVSEWIGQLKAGEAEAAQRIWERYSHSLLNLAKLRLRDVPKIVSDEEDVAQSVFQSICRGAAAGRFERLSSRDDLWWMLLTVTQQKVVNFIRRETAMKRGSGLVWGEVDVLHGTRNGGSFQLDELIGDVPTPDFIIMLEDEHQRLMSLLRDDLLRQVAALRIEGFGVAEIADKLNVATRSVDRKLAIIRQVWAKELKW